jgi:hypothetical protein
MRVAFCLAAKEMRLGAGLGQHCFQHLHHKFLFLPGQLANALDAAFKLRHRSALAAARAGHGVSADKRTQAPQLLA